MNCPKCKCPNAPGSTYCAMCYETLNRSAADNFIRNVQRERYANVKRQKDGTSGHPLNTFSRQIGEFFDHVDWLGIKVLLLGKFCRYKKIIGWTVVGFIALTLFIMANEPSIRFRALGPTFSYWVPEHGMRQYLTGFQTDYKSWSEWNHQLDTPMEDYHADEIGNILMQRGAPLQTGTTLNFVPKEWILIRRGLTSSTSRTIPLQDPSLMPIYIVLDAKGHVAERPTVYSHRMGRALNLLMPVFPSRSLRIGNHWTESVEWMEMIGNWKIYWTGQLHWTLNAVDSCPEGACAELSYTGQLKPQLWASPEWATGGLGQPSFQTGPVKGSAIFEVRHHRLVSNTLTYDVMLRVPIHDLARIPWQLRVGRRVQGVPGDLVVTIKNRLDVHEN